MKYWTIYRFLIFMPASLNQSFFKRSVSFANKYFVCFFETMSFAILWPICCHRWLNLTLTSQKLFWWAINFNWCLKFLNLIRWLNWCDFIDTWRLWGISLIYDYWFFSWSWRQNTFWSYLFFWYFFKLTHTFFFLSYYSIISLQDYLSCLFQLIFLSSLLFKYFLFFSAHFLFQLFKLLLCVISFLLFFLFFLFNSNFFHCRTSI